MERKIDRKNKKKESKEETARQGRGGFSYVTKFQIPIKFKMKEKSRTAIFFHNLIGNLVT
jgi:hypothetical protein